MSNELTGARTRTLEAQEETQSGNGAPVHNAADGTYYWDFTNADLYINDSGTGTFGNSWQHIGGGGVPVAHQLLDNPWHTDTATQGPTQGSIIYATAVPQWDELVHPGAASRVLTTDANDVLWSANQLILTASLTNNGGAANQAAYWSALNTLAGENQLALVRGGTGADLSATGGANQYVQQAGVGAAFTVGPIAAAAIAHNILDGSVHSDSAVDGVTRGSLIVGNATPLWDELVIGGAGTILYSDGNDPSWQTFAAINVVTGTGANTQVTYWTGANTIAGDAGFTYDAANDSITLTSAVSNKPVILVENTNADALGSILRFNKDSAGPADNDDIAIISFYGDTSTAANVRYSYILTETADVTNADYAGRYIFYAAMDATERSLLRLDGYYAGVNQGAVIVNDDNQDVDFWVEAVGVPDALAVQGSDGQITLGALGAGLVQSTAGGVLSSSYTIGALVTFSAGWVLSGGTGDLNGFDLIIDANGDSYLHASADDVVDLVLATGAGEFGITINAAEDFTFTANSFNVLSGSNISLADGCWIGIPANELLTVNAAGTWAFSGVSGVSVEDGDWIGAGSGCAWLYDSGNGDISTTVNVGIGTAALGNNHLYVYNNALNSAATFRGIYVNHTKTAGAGALDDYYGVETYMSLNQATTIDNLFGALVTGNLTLGTADLIIGAMGQADIDGGTVSVDARGVYAYMTVDGGTVPDIYGVSSRVDLNAGTISNDVYGVHIWVDDDIGASGTVYMLYLAENTGIDYGIYQSGTADNYLGGDLGIGDAPPDARLDVSITDAVTAAITDVAILEHLYTGGSAPAADFGAGLLYQLEDAGGTSRNAMRLATVWQSAAAAENAEFQLYLNYDGTLYDCGVLVGPGAASVAGNQRGTGSVDWQGHRGAATQVASGVEAVLSGGGANTASGDWGTVCGGQQNTASGTNATACGGTTNTASGTSDWAGGAGATASHGGCFVWSSAAATVSWAANTWTARCHGGARFYSAAGVATGVQLTAGASAWAAISDRATKENFVDIGPEILDRVASLPIYNYNLKSQSPDVRHIGPVAQDFNAIFGFTEAERYINMLDISGVALAAVQQLIFENRELRQHIEHLEAQ